VRAPSDVPPAVAAVLPALLPPGGLPKNAVVPFGRLARAPLRGGAPAEDSARTTPVTTPRSTPLASLVASGHHDMGPQRVAGRDPLQGDIELSERVRAAARAEGLWEMRASDPACLDSWKSDVVGGGRYCNVVRMRGPDGQAPSALRPKPAACRRAGGAPRRVSAVFAERCSPLMTF